MIKIRRFERETTEEEISALEFKLGSRLSSDYRDFLMRSNGGKPERHKILVDDELGGVMVRGFFGIRANEHYDFEHFLQTYKGRIPRGSIPIANDSFGNLFLMSLTGKDRGAIYFWDHDFEAEEDASTWFDNTHFIARSFTELFEKMEPPDPLPNPEEIKVLESWTSPKLQEIIDAQNAKKEGD